MRHKAGLLALVLGAALQGGELPVLTPSPTPAQLWVGVVERNELGPSESAGISNSQVNGESFRYLRKENYKLRFTTADHRNAEVRVRVKNMGGSQYSQFLAGVVLGELTNAGTAADAAIQAQALAASGAVSLAKRNFRLTFKQKVSDPSSPENMVTCDVTFVPEPGSQWPPDFIDIGSRATMAHIDLDALGNTYAANAPGFPTVSVPPNKQAAELLLKNRLLTIVSAISGQRLQSFESFFATNFFPQPQK